MNGTSYNLAEGNLNVKESVGDFDETRTLNAAESFVLLDTGVGGLNEFGVEFCFQDLCHGGLGSHVELFTGCLNSDQQVGCLDFDQEVGLFENNTMDRLPRREFGICVHELDESAEGLCFDVDWLVRCLDSDREYDVVQSSSQKRKYEAESGRGLCCDALGNPVNKLATRKSGVGVEDLNEFAGNTCLDNLGVFDIDWFVRCLDSNQEQKSFGNSTTNKLVKRKFGGGFCSDDDLGNFDVDWFMQCLESNQEEDLVEDSTTNKLEKGKYEAESGGGFCSDDDLGKFDLDWFMQCLNSNQEEELVEDSTTNKLENRKYEAESGGGFCSDDLGDFHIDWITQLLDSNQEEKALEHNTISELRKRKFEGEGGNSCPTKKICL